MQENIENDNRNGSAARSVKISNPVTKSKKWIYDLNDCISQMTYGVKVRKLSRRRMSSRQSTIFLHPSEPTLLCWATKAKKINEATLDLKDCKIKILEVKLGDGVSEDAGISLIDTNRIKSLEDDLELYQVKEYDRTKNFKSVATRRKWKENYFIGILSSNRELVVGFENKFTFFKVFWFLTLFTSPDPYTNSNLSMSLLSEESCNYQRMKSIKNFEFLKSKENWNQNFKLVREGEYEEIKDVLRSSDMADFEEEITKKLETIMKMNFGYRRKDVFQLLLIEKNRNYVIPEFKSTRNFRSLKIKFRTLQKEKLIEKDYNELVTMIKMKIFEEDLMDLLPVYLHSNLNLINQNYHTNFLKFKRFNWLSSCPLGRSLVKAANYEALGGNIEDFEDFLLKVKMLFDLKYRAISLTLIDDARGRIGIETRNRDGLINNIQEFNVFEVLERIFEMCFSSSNSLFILNFRVRLRPENEKRIASWIKEFLGDNLLLPSLFNPCLIKLKNLCYKILITIEDQNSNIDQIRRSPSYKSREFLDDDSDEEEDMVNDEVSSRHLSNYGQNPFNRVIPESLFNLRNGQVMSFLSSLKSQESEIDKGPRQKLSKRAHTGKILQLDDIKMQEKEIDDMQSFSKDSKSMAVNRIMRSDSEGNLGSGRRLKSNQNNNSRFSKTFLNERSIGDDMEPSGDMDRSNANGKGNLSINSGNSERIEIFDGLKVKVEKNVPGKRLTDSNINKKLSDSSKFFKKPLTKISTFTTLSLSKERVLKVYDNEVLAADYKALAFDQSFFGLSSEIVQKMIKNNRYNILQTSGGSPFNDFVYNSGIFKHCNMIALNPFSDVHNTKTIINFNDILFECLGVNYGYVSFTEIKLMHEQFRFFIKEKDPFDDISDESSPGRPERGRDSQQGESNQVEINIRDKNILLKIDLVSLNFIGDAVRRNLTLRKFKLRVGYHSSIITKVIREVELDIVRGKKNDLREEKFNILVKKTDLCFITFSIYGFENETDEDGRVCYREIFTPDEVKSGYRCVYFGNTHCYLFLKIRKDYYS